MNKQGLWFLTLFTLVLVLSVYYFTMPDDLLKSNNSQDTSVMDEIDTNIEESDSVVAYQETLKDERNKEIDSLKSTMLDSSKTTEEKNDAFEQIKYLNELTGKEEKLEEKIKSSFNFDNFIKVNNNDVKVVIATKDHNVELANKIMNSVQEEFDNKMYITVKFES